MFVGRQQARPLPGCGRRRFLAKGCTNMGSCQDACDGHITDNHADRSTIAIFNTMALPPGGGDSEIGLNAHGHTCASKYNADASRCGECGASNFTANTMCCRCGGGTLGQAPTPTLHATEIYHARDRRLHARSRRSESGDEERVPVQSRGKGGFDPETQGHPAKQAPQSLNPMGNPGPLHPSPTPISPKTCKNTRQSDQ